MKERSLICITTCNRSDALRVLVWDYVRFCQTDDRFDLVISLDGDDPNTIAYCHRHGIPVLYSDVREGVGLSKNRVLEAYPEYGHYFFIEDDVELLDASVFQIHIDAARESGLPHFSAFPIDRLRKKEESSRVGRWTFQHGWYGGGTFNFFTRSGLDAVGGFDLSFAELRRFGHTEHSYRYVHAGLCRFPFNLIEQCLVGYFRWTEPGTVTRVNVPLTEDRLYRGEAELIAQQRNWQPIATLSSYIKPDSLDLGDVRPDRAFFFHNGWYRSKIGARALVRGLKRMLRQGLSRTGRNTGSVAMGEHGRQPKS